MLGGAARKRALRRKRACIAERLDPPLITAPHCG